MSRTRMFSLLSAITLAATTLSACSHSDYEPSQELEHLPEAQTHKPFSLGDTYFGSGITATPGQTTTLSINQPVHAVLIPLEGIANTIYGDQGATLERTPASAYDSLDNLINHLNNKDRNRDQTQRAEEVIGYDPKEEQRAETMAKVEEITAEKNIDTAKALEEIKKLDPDTPQSFQFTMKDDVPIGSSVVMKIAIVPTDGFDTIDKSLDKSKHASTQHPPIFIGNITVEAAEDAPIHHQLLIQSMWETIPDSNQRLQKLDQRVRDAKKDRLNNQSQ